MSAAIFAALADPSRRAILERLAERPHAVHELAALLPVTRSAVSQHLKILRDAGLASESREGKFVFYRAQPENLRSVADWLTRLNATQAQAAPTPTPERKTLARRAEAREEEELLDAELARWERQWPGTNPLQSALRAWIRGVSRILEQSAAALGDRFGINLTDISILGVLHRIGPPHESTPTNLSRVSLTSLPGMTRRLDHLEKQGLIKRIASDDDRRSRIVRLSAAGSALLHEYVRAQFTTPLEPAFDLPADDLRAIARGMLQLLTRLQRLESGQSRGDSR